MTRRDGMVWGAHFAVWIAAGVVMAGAAGAATFALAFLAAAAGGYATAAILSRV